MPRAIRRFHLEVVALSCGLALAQPAFSDARAQGSGRSVQAPSRCTNDWVERPIGRRATKDGDAGTAFLGAPSAARGRSGLYIVGRIVPRSAPNAAVSSAVLIGPGGTLLPLPVGADRGELFRIAVAEPDSIYLLWGISNPPADTAQGRRSAYPTELWFSSRTRGKGWAVPERLFTALAIEWEDAQVPEVVRDTKGAFHLAFAAERAWANATLVHVTMRSGRASVDALALHGVAGYVSAAPTRSGLLVAFVAPDFVKARNANSVFVIDADESGFLPPARMVMSSPGEEQAVALRAVTTPDQAVHLVWVEQRDANTDPLLRHTVSRDGGSQWSPWSDATYAGLPHITAMPNGRDGVSVFYTIWKRTGPSHSEVMCWNGEWNGPARLGGALTLLDPHPVVGSAARPWLVATAKGAGSTPANYRVAWLERAAQTCRAGSNVIPCRK
jgi:hypothetical protein